MQPAESKDKNKERLLEKIVPVILGKGLKGATMDGVAAVLGISKRTLYETFGSKSEMINEALDFMQCASHRLMADAFANSENAMEALIIIFKHNRDVIGNINVEFYRDMDRLYKDKRAGYDRDYECRRHNMLKIFELGVKQGIFREDVDYDVYSRTLRLQLEAIKRIEELFPKDVPLLRVFDTIILGFLRSIASPKGMEVLESKTKNLTT